MKWFLAAFVFRLLLLPVYHHEDADSFFYWSKFLWEKKDFLFFLGKSVPNAVKANYPPLFYYLIFLWRGVYELLGRFLWWLNINISFFPSNLIFWYQSYDIGVAFNKIPAVLADLGCAFLIFKILDSLGSKKERSNRVVILFLFLPATWYVSAVWGQVESIYTLFLLWGFYLAITNRFLLGTFVVAVSFLIKPIGVVVLPVFGVFFLKKRKILDFTVGMVLALILALVSFFPFFPINTFSQAAKYYIGNFKGSLDEVSSNAFNFWELVFGSKKVPSADFPILGLPVSFWGEVIFLVLLLLICFKLWKKTTRENFILATFLCTFSAFLFLPRMHERYFYPALAFLAILAGLKKRWLNFFIFLSVVHFLNLYRFWWFPKVSILISVLSNLIVVQSIILVSITVFFCFLIDLGKE